VRAPFLVLAAVAAVVTVALLRGHTRDTPFRHQPLRETLHAARRDRVVLAAVAVIVLVGVMSGALNLLVPLVLRANGFSSGATGVVISLSSAVFVLGSVLITRRGTPAVTLGLVGVAALLYAGVTLIPVVATSSAALIVFLLVRSPPWAALSTLAYPLGGLGADRADVGRGAVMGLMNLVWGAAGSIAPVAAGAIAQAASERWAFAALAACSLATGLWLLAGREVTGAAVEPAPSFDG